jgi:hypothetical protein
VDIVNLCPNQIYAYSAILTIGAHLSAVPQLHKEPVSALASDPGPIKIKFPFQLTAGYLLKGHLGNWTIYHI